MTISLMTFKDYAWTYPELQTLSASAMHPSSPFTHAEDQSTITSQSSACPSWLSTNCQRKQASPQSKLSSAGSFFATKQTHRVVRGDSNHDNKRHNIIERVRVKYRTIGAHSGNNAIHSSFFEQTMRSTHQSQKETNNHHHRNMHRRS